MANLYSEDDEVKTIFKLSLLSSEFKRKENISWIGYEVNLISANNTLNFKKKKIEDIYGDYVFSIEPVNEIQKFVHEVNQFILDPEKNIYSFEPLEPSIEINFEKSHKGISAYIWVDSGNVISKHYSWDGFGLRFFTTEIKIKNFLEDLEKEAKLIQETCKN